MARSMRLSWQRLRAVEIALAVVHGHSTVRMPSSVNIRPLSLPTIGKGTLVTVNETRSGDYWQVFVKISVLDDAQVEAWLYRETYFADRPGRGERNGRHLEPHRCKFDHTRGWRDSSSVVIGGMLSDKKIMAPFR